MEAADADCNARDERRQHEKSGRAIVATGSFVADIKIAERGVDRDPTTESAISATIKSRRNPNIPCGARGRGNWRSCSSGLP